MNALLFFQATVVEVLGKVYQMKSTDSSACFFRVCRVLMGKMAHLAFLESR